jgi:hypothetical protein
MTAQLNKVAQQAEKYPEYLAFLFRLSLNEHTAYTLDDVAQQPR